MDLRGYERVSDAARHAGTGSRSDGEKYRTDQWQKFGGGVMSISVMSLVWKVPFPTANQMLIALKLADHAEDDGTKVYPGKASLAERARCSESTVKNTLRIFRDAGILIVVEEGGKGPHHTTKYRINLSLLQRIADGSVAISGSSEGIELGWSDSAEEKGSDFDPLAIEEVSRLSVRGQPAGAKGSAGSPQPIKNHQEPSAGARATRSAARPALEVKAGDMSWSEWLEAIEEKLGADARRSAARLGKISVTARWPREGVPMPSIEIVRDPTGEAA